MSQNELTAIIRELKEYQIMADEIAATIDDLKDKVKATMTAQGVDEMTVDIPDGIMSVPELARYFGKLRREAGIFSLRENGHAQEHQRIGGNCGWQLWP